MQPMIQIPGPVSLPAGTSRAQRQATARQPQPILITGGLPYGWYLCKRVFDVLSASALLVLLSPVLAVIAALIKLDSPGDVFHVQERVGSRRRRGKARTWELHNFRFFKFRSMFSQADESLHRRYVEDFCKGRVATEHFKLRDDPRVTRVGRFLRKTSLDELPQLFNVLRGEMSLVGPRPVPRYEVTHYDESCFERFAALGGLTGLWQVRGRGRVSFEEMIRMDIEYVRTASPWLDLKILFLTFPAVLSRRGAE